MTVIAFRPSTPSPQAVAAELLALSPRHPRWSLECYRSDDGQPFAEIECRTTGAMLGAHWGNGGWAVINEAGTIVSRSRDLSAALERALA